MRTNIVTSKISAKVIPADFAEPIDGMQQTRRRLIRTI
jgi:hypothetical protein